MKKFLTVLLVLGMILALAACGDTKQADVVENVDPVNNSVVIETPPAIVSGPDTPTETYPAVNALPTTAPTTVPDPSAVNVPAASAAPGGTGTGTEGNGTGTEGTGTGTGTEATPEPTTDPGKPYNATATKYEIEHGKEGYVVRAENGVFFRVGPGTEYEIICGLKIGTPVLIVDEMTSGWCKVVYDGDVGFIYGSYLSYTNPLDPVIVTETPAPAESPAPTVVIITP